MGGNYEYDQRWQSRPLCGLVRTTVMKIADTAYAIIRLMKSSVASGASV
jgi:hypothetical protein